MHKLRQARGFTLIEILVSLTLLGIIFLLLFSCLYTSNKSWIAGEKKISRNDEVRLVSHFLRRHIHVRRGEDSCKFWLSPVVLAYNDGLKPREIRTVEQVVRERRDDFERAWNDYFTK